MGHALVWTSVWYKLVCLLKYSQPIMSTGSFRPQLPLLCLVKYTLAFHGAYLIWLEGIWLFSLWKVKRVQDTLNRVNLPLKWGSDEAVLCWFSAVSSALMVFIVVCCFCPTSCFTFVLFSEGAQGAGAVESAAGVLIKLFCVHTKWVCLAATMGSGPYPTLTCRS